MLNGLSDPLQMFHSDRGGEGLGTVTQYIRSPLEEHANYWDCTLLEGAQKCSVVP